MSRVHTLPYDTLGMHNLYNHIYMKLICITKTDERYKVGKLLKSDLLVVMHTRVYLKNTHSNLRGIQGNMCDRGKVMLSLHEEDKGNREMILNKFKSRTNHFVDQYSRENSIHDREFIENNLPPGCILVRNAISTLDQIKLAKVCLETFAYFPHNNVSALIQNVFEYEKLTREEFLRKLKWSNLGYHFDWTNRRYHKGDASEFPSELKELCINLAKQAGFHEEYDPQAAIVNFSQKKSKYIYIYIAFLHPSVN